MFLNLLIRKNLFSIVALLALGLFPLVTSAGSNLCIDLLNFRTPLLELVTALEEPDALPATVIARSDSIELAEMLVKRMSFKYEFKNPAHQKNDLKNSRLIMFFRDQLIEKIRRHGFRNQHQTGTTLGVRDTKMRREVEEQLIHLHFPKAPWIRSKVNQLRPKYAFVDLIRKRGAYNPMADPEWLDYGAIGAVFKEEVKKRATWTAVDSLMLLDWQTMLDLKKGLKARYRNSILEGSDEGANRIFSEYIGTFWGKRRLKNPQTTSRGWHSYVEAQIWGRLDLSHVDHFVINLKDDRINDRVIDELKSLGIPIYAYMWSEQNGQYRLKETSIIWQP